jgi:hypothetical protein
MKELEIIVLMVDLPAYNLKKGDIGTIVAVYDSGKAYEVEFITYLGQTLAVITLQPEQINAINDHLMMSARNIDHAA